MRRKGVGIWGRGRDFSWRGELRLLLIRKQVMVMGYGWMSLWVRPGSCSNRISNIYPDPLVSLFIFFVNRRWQNSGPTLSYLVQWFRTHTITSSPSVDQCPQPKLPEGDLSAAVMWASLWSIWCGPPEIQQPYRQNAACNAAHQSFPRMMSDEKKQGCRRRLVPCDLPAMV